MINNATYPKSNKPYVILAYKVCVDHFGLRIDEAGYIWLEAITKYSCDYCNDLTGRPKY